MAGTRDGKGGHRDYYVPWAFHAYGLIFARYGADLHPGLAETFCERARLFAPQFARWFGADGAALPFGRSLTYRFAQGAFWAALAFSGTEALPWGTIRGLLARHLRWWLRQSIFDAQGKLVVGYGYPNPFMGEYYNSAGSSYWALKALLPLSLPEHHAFWQAKEAPLPEIEEPSFQSANDFLLTRDPVQGHVLMLNNHEAGQSFVRHAAAKYGKFAYSSGFSFSYPMKEGSLEEGGLDNTLAVSTDSHHWRSREKTVNRGRHGGSLYSRWSPWPDWDIETWLVPALPGYVAIHRIQASVSAEAFAGGFSLAYRDIYNEITTRETSDSLEVESRINRSSIRILQGEGRGYVFRPEPNTHLLQPWIYQVGFRCGLKTGTQWLVYVAAAWNLPFPQEAESFTREFSFSADEANLLWKGRVIWSLEGPENAKAESI